MTVDEFTHHLTDLDGERISAIATALRSELDTAEGEVAWWRATIAVSGTLRRHHLTREASLAAHAASTALVSAAERAGTNSRDVTTVARAAAEVARVLVAGRPVPMPSAVADPLLHAWHDVVDAA